MFNFDMVTSVVDIYKFKMRKCKRLHIFHPRSPTMFVNHFLVPDICFSTVRKKLSSMFTDNLHEKLKLIFIFCSISIEVLDESLSALSSVVDDSQPYDYWLCFSKCFILLSKSTKDKKTSLQPAHADQAPEPVSWSSLCRTVRDHWHQEMHLT